MSAGREADRSDAIRIDLILGGVGAQPAHGRLAILDLGWEPGGRAETITDGHGHVAASRHALDRLFQLLAISRFPTSSVNAHDGREGAFTIFGHGQVQFQVRLASLAIDQIGLNANFGFLLLSAD